MNISQNRISHFYYWDWCKLFAVAETSTREEGVYLQESQGGAGKGNSWKEKEIKSSYRM